MKFNMWRWYQCQLVTDKAIYEFHAVYGLTRFFFGKGYGTTEELSWRGWQLPDNARFNWWLTLMRLLLSRLIYGGLTYVNFRPRHKYALQWKDKMLLLTVFRKKERRMKVTWFGLKTIRLKDGA